MILIEVMVTDLSSLARKNYVALSTLYLMIEHKNTSSQFDHVLIESGIIRTQIWIYDNENQLSYSCGTIDLPLDDVPDLPPKEGIAPKVFAQDILNRAQPILDKEYPGGHQQAVEDFFSWLSTH